jgi:fructokinase
MVNPRSGVMFVVCGEALFDVYATATEGGLALDARIGGSPLNVARGLARLAQPVAFLGAVARDFLGDRLVRSLVDEGIDTQFVQRVDAPCTLGFVGLDDAGVAAYTFYGEGAADRRLRDVPELPPSVQALQVGSYTMVTAPAALALRRLVAREARRRFIAYDVNVRLNVAPQVAAWRGALDAIAPHADVVKLSDEDLALLAPGVDEAAFAGQLRAAGAAWVVVTRGAAGATAYTAAGRVQVPGRAVDVIDTVGAGDTFQAALLTWLAEHERLSRTAIEGATASDVQHALAFAVRAASITCTRRGADLPRRAELDPSASGC